MMLRLTRLTNHVPVIIIIIIIIVVDDASSSYRCHEHARLVSRSLTRIDALAHHLYLADDIQKLDAKCLFLSRDATLGYWKRFICVARKILPSKCVTTEAAKLLSSSVTPLVFLTVN